MNTRLLFASVLFCAACFSPSNSDAITFTNDATINILNTNYDGLGVVVSNCTLTVNGPHAFSSLLVAAGGKLTHSSDGTGLTTDVLSVTNESHVLTGTNAVSLVNSNVVLATVSVWDASSTVLYTNNVDYTLGVNGSGFTQLARTTNSSIPDGTNVLVSYNWQAAQAGSSVNLAVSGDVAVTAGGFIDAAGRGFSSISATGRGGSAGNPLSGGGGGNGGMGGNSSSNGVGGGTLNFYLPPNILGGAGGTGSGGGGAAGGGLVTIQCGGTFTLNGVINVNGLNATNSRGGGGAGGGVYIVTTNFAGSGSIIANGGAGEPIHGGGGGGGRIAVEFATNTFGGSLSAVGGAGWQAGGAGTLFVRQFGTAGQLTLDNGGVAGAGSLLTVITTPNLTVQRGASVLLPSATTVGELLVRSNSSILTFSTNNATLSITALSNATVEATAQLNMNGRGFFRGLGSGAGGIASGGTAGGGAGHGGYGGRIAFGITNGNGGVVYDTLSSPTQSGSGAGSTYPLSGNGWGGGVIRLIVTGNLFLNGDLRADATSGVGDIASGGSGGSVWVTTGGLYGAGKMTADGGGGGMNYAGGGGGGRIAVYYTSNSFTGTYSAHGGNAAYPGGAGTIYIKPPQGIGNLIVDNAGLRGAFTLRDSISLNDLTVANGAALSNTFTSDLFGNVVVGTNAVLFFASSSPTLSINSNLTVAAGGLISLDGSSSTTSTSGSGGGGHGGAGGAGVTSLGGGFGSDAASAPGLVGGAGGFGLGTGVGNSGRGGGALNLSVLGSLTLNGRMSANGLDGGTNNAGGGAGGSLRVSAIGLSGAGVFSADGGNGYLPNGGGGGGGGGGRIAINCSGPSNTFTGTFSAKGGNGYQRGGAGTVFFKKDSRSINPSVVVDNGGFVGTNTAVTVNGFNAIDLTIQGGGLISFWSGPSLASLLIRSNSWLAIGGNYTVLSNATLEAGGGIRLDGVGTGGSGTGNNNVRGGAGHGGFGGGNFSPFAGGGNVYDSITFPTLDGSTGGGSGGSSFPVGGKGGDAMQLNVQGILRVDGRLSSDGLSGDLGAGGGSGGSLLLTLNQFKGTGTISANGGTGLPSGGQGGGGGGGRIAVTWNFNTSNSFTGTYSARGGDGAGAGGAGTIYLKRNDQSFSTLMVDDGGLSGATNTPVSPGLGSSWNLSVLGGAVAQPSTTLTGLSNLIVGAGSRFTVASGNTSLPLTVLDSVTVAAGGAISVDGKGYAHDSGINGGQGASIASKGAGGGYGGFGGASASNAKGGTNNGSATQPVDFGSGGGSGANIYNGGSEGGGALKLVVPGTLTLDGILSANGDAGLQDDSGGGAGGSIWVTAKNIVGAGVVAADGGDGELYGGGGGGGGRIAIYAKTTNGFTGSMSALGGDGANAGQDGTIVFTTNLFLSILSYSPSGVTSNTVGTMAFNFSQLIDPATVTPSAFTLTMPTNYTGPQPALSASAPVGSSTAGLTFLPTLSVPGDYTVTVAPSIKDIFGTPLSQVYTGAFTVVVPTVEGYVRTTNGAGVAGVTVQTPGYLPTTTDATGNYVLGVPPNWSGSIVPSLGANMFVPGSIVLANVTAQTTNQNFVMVPTILPNVSSGVSGTNLQFNWTGFSSVTYQAYVSSNLVDWVPWGSPLPGTNGPMQLQIPIGTDTQSFFRLGASN